MFRIPPFQLILIYKNQSKLINILALHMKRPSQTVSDDVIIFLNCSLVYVLSIPRESVFSSLKVPSYSPDMPDLL